MNYPTEFINPAIQAALDDYNPAIAKVNYDAIEKLEVPDLPSNGLGATLEGALGAHPDRFVPYFIAMNSMNFKFWELDENKQLQRYAHNGIVGALGMQKAFLKAWNDAYAEQEDIDCSEFVQSLSAAEVLRAKVQELGVEFIFGNIPNAEQRKNILLEVLEERRLRFACEHIMIRCESQGQLDSLDAKFLAKLMPQGYGDRYLKKAQLTLMFIKGQWSETQNTDIEIDVSVAADYQEPKVMRHTGAIEYSEQLAEIVRNLQVIEPDSEYERAIRSATVLAGVAIAKRFNAKQFVVDTWGWLNRNITKENFHLCDTSNY